MSIQGLALRGGGATGSAIRGGVIYNRPPAPATTELIEVEVSGGIARTGGGVYNLGILTIDRSVVSGNQTSDFPSETGNHGGGIASTGNSAELAINDSEISGNQSHSSGGAVWVNGGECSIFRSKLNDNVAGENGGGFLVRNATYGIQFVEFARNQADVGGGMYMGAMGEVQRSAFIQNQATSAGGGLADGFGGFARYSTFVGNTAPYGAGVYADTLMTLLDSNTIARNNGVGVYNDFGVFFENTLIAENSGGNCAGVAPAFGAFNLEDANSCGFVSSAGTPNLPNTDPMLDVLRDNGGPTPTLALLPGSPAIDAVSSEIRINCERMLDQRAYSRGRPRTQNAAGDDVFLCDIGAYEVPAPFVVDALIDAVDADPNDDLCSTAAGECTLRAAIQQANEIPGMTEVSLGPGVHELSIGGTDEEESVTGDLDAHRPITIRGAGAGLTTIEGNGFDRVFDLGWPEGELVVEAANPAGVIIRDLTIRGGDAGGDNGGAILARRALRVENVVLSNNYARRGGAIATNRAGNFSVGSDHLVEVIDSTVTQNSGALPLFLVDGRIEGSSLIENVATLTINGGAGEFVRVHMKNSTVSGNFAQATGAFFADQAIIEDSTIYGNFSDFGPGGIFLLEHSIARNSIIADNLAAGVPDNCSLNPSALVSVGYNLTDTDGSDCNLIAPTDQTLTAPDLADLADNGGPTRTHAPLPGSAAIDSGDDASCPATDQRGFFRPADGDDDGTVLCDIGAVEVPEPTLLGGLIAGGLSLAGIARSRRRRTAADGRDGVMCQKSADVYAARW